MRLIAAKEVREGMCLARDVRDGRGRILLARGQRMTGSLIARLYRFEIEAVYIRDGYGDSEPELLKSEVRQQCQEALADSFARLAGDAARKCLVLDSQAVQAASERLIEGLLACPHPLITLLDMGASADPLMQHSVNAAALAVTLGIDLRLPAAMLNHLAAGMLFHDIGLGFLPEALTQKAGPLTPQEMLVLREHPRRGFEHLARTRAVSDIAANLVLRHHEALDGSGYPGGLRGEQLSILMRIAHVAEVYDALTSPRPYAPPVLPDAALTYMLQNTGRLFAKEVALALCRRVALYPTGMAVLLNTGESGIVAKTPRDAPMRPTVAVHLDAKGRALKRPEIVDLMAEPGRAVARSAPSLPLLAQQRRQAAPPQGVNAVFANIG